MAKTKSTKFSIFINKIYKYKKEMALTTISYLKKLFEAAGCKNFYYSDESLKSYFNGIRTIQDDLWDSVPKKFDMPKLRTFFQETTNELRIQELFNEFEIDPDDKIDLDVFYESLASMFFNFVKYGEDNNTTVKSIYSVLIDQYNNGLIDKANEKAVFAAKSMFYNVLKCLDGIQPVQTLFNTKEPIEGMIQNLYQVFRAFEAKCNRLGRIAYKSLQNKLINKNKSVTKFLKLAAEPGALPIDLEKLVIVTIYDNVTFNDFYAIRKFNLESQEYTMETLLEAFKDIPIADKVNEIFFSETITYNLANDDENLLEELRYSIETVYDFLNKLEREFPTYKPTVELNEKIKPLYRNRASINTFTTNDGTYYPQTKEIHFAPSIECYMHTTDEEIVFPGDQVLPISNLGRNGIKGETYEETFYRFCMKQIYVLTLGKEADLMNECILFFRNGTCRYYMVAPTAKAKVYRFIRKIAQTAKDEDALAFMYQTMTVTNFAEDLQEMVENTTSEQRQETGMNTLLCCSYYDGKYVSYCYDADEIVRTKKPVEPTLEAAFFNPFKPLVDAIKENEKKGTDIQGLKKIDTKKASSD